MGCLHRIWSPVILSEMAPRPVQISRTYQLDRTFQIIEDIKVRVRTIHAVFHGRYIAVHIHVDVICLLKAFEDVELVQRNAEIEEWLPVELFDPAAVLDKKTHFVLDIQDLIGEGELKETELHMMLKLVYTVMATHYQVVEISAESDEYPESPVILRTVHRLEEDVQRLEWDKEELRRKVILYEKNILSLKNGIRKAENRNMILNRDLSECFRLIEELRSKLEAKNTKPMWKNLPHRIDYDSTANAASAGQTAIGNPAPEKSPLDSRVKHVFVN